MSAAGVRRPPWRGMLVPMLAALVVLLALGTWQVERRAWKEGLIAALTQRLSAEPAALPARAAWDALRAADEEFRRVRFTAEFEHGNEALVYSSGSPFRNDATRPGYWVFTPVRLADGRRVIVNRGFVPDGRQDAKTRAEGQVAGPVEIVGALRWPEARSWFTPNDDSARNLWFLRDHRAIAAAKELRDVAPFYVEQEAPSPPGGLPHPSALTARLRNEHLQYALTWYGLAAVLVVVFVVWARSRGTGQAS